MPAIVFSHTFAMNELFVLLGLEHWKPLIAALLLPPVPLLLGVLIGARLILPHRGWGWLLVALSVAGLWLTTTVGLANAMEQWVFKVPPALSENRLGELKVRSKREGGMAIVVLGGGRELQAPEYHLSNLSPLSLERLRYGQWLAREIGAPVAYTGGTGWGQPDGLPEAEIAARIATQEFGRPLRWIETLSRDTHENAERTAQILRSAGVKHVLLVTHGWHMQRAHQAFEAALGNDIEIELAPMGLARRVDNASLDWLPSERGFARVRWAMREWIGRMSGA
jgi:uncharacterized SAM-binding protein YcdF (DUF218 family)